MAGGKKADKPIEVKRKKKEEEPVKVARYDSAAIQRALDDILVDLLFQKKPKGAVLESEVLPLAEVTWYKDLLIGVGVSAVALAVWLYFRAALSPRIFYAGGLALFGVLYATMELFRYFWVRGVTCITKPKKRAGAVVFPGMRFTSKMEDFSATYELKASWGKAPDQSVTLRKDVNNWIDVNGVVQKNLYRADVAKFLDEIVAATSSKQKK